MNNKSKIKVGSRSSQLALVQVNEIFALLSDAGIKLEYDLVKFETGGDKNKSTSLTSADIPDDFFTDTIDQALVENKIDISINSAKDLPEYMRDDLSIFALTAPIDATDAFVGRCKFSELPPGAKIGTSSLIRQQGIKDLNPALEVVDIRGTIEERLAQLREGKYDGIIIATCALKRLGLEKEITEILPWEASPLQGQLAVVGRKDDHELRRIFAAIDVKRNYGSVNLVGAGPGDPELITVKAFKALKEADCVVYDHSVHKDLLMYAPNAEKIYAGKRKGEHSIPQSELCKILRQKAMAGKKVVRLKGGDPLVFGRGAEEIEYLQSYYIPVGIIPGITAGTGILSSLGIPLTARGISSSVAFVSGHKELEQGPAPMPVEIPKVDTLVFFMGMTKLGVIMQGLLESGWKETVPVLVVSKGTQVDEKIVKGEIRNIEGLVAEQRLGPPGLIVVGEVVDFWRKSFRRKLENVENILYLGTSPDKYKSLGSVIHHPMIEISAVEIEAACLQRLLDELESYNVILLTSRFSVRYFFELIKDKPEAFAKIRVLDFAVIGEETAFALEQYDIVPKVIAEEETSVGMFAALKQVYDLKGKRILFPRSSLPNPYLKEHLTKEGAEVTQLTVYQNTKPERKNLPDTPINKVIFTSPSTVKNFLEDYGSIPAEWQIFSKGPRTSDSLKDSGYQSEMLVFK